MFIVKFKKFSSTVSAVKASQQLNTSQGQPKDVLFQHLHHFPENKRRQGWIYQVHASVFPLFAPLRDLRQDVSCLRPWTGCFSHGKQCQKWKAMFQLTIITGLLPNKGEWISCLARRKSDI